LGRSIRHAAPAFRGRAALLTGRGLDAAVVTVER